MDLFPVLCKCYILYLKTQTKKLCDFHYSDTFECALDESHKWAEVMNLLSSNKDKNSRFTLSWQRGEWANSGREFGSQTYASAASRRASARSRSTSVMASLRAAWVTQGATRRVMTRSWQHSTNTPPWLDSLQSLTPSQLFQCNVNTFKIHIFKFMNQIVWHLQ